MSRRVYASGVLLEEWDDATLTYRRFVNGEVVEERTYTAPEIAAIVGAGAVVINERQMVVLDDGGNEILRIGDMEWGDRGLVIRRQNGGEVAFEMKETFSSSTSQSVYIRGDDGSQLLAEEAVGNGLAYPIFDIHMDPVLATAGAVNAGPYGFEVPTTSGTYATVFRANISRNNQFATFKMRVAASDTSTSGEFRIVSNSGANHLGQVFAGPYTATRSTGSTGYTEVVLNSIFMPGSPWDYIDLEIQARRTAGSGTLRVAVAESRGGGA